ncbi:HAMP domain-containing histidine kinase [Myroides odoratimimus]|uniref:HAMP domain-containing sensor histidine kinase n=1 Tax=Myroides odoratimimus TaxID=76832 RepID=UPI002579099A|nr:HAMP domain-containing sensor histidine kinase [Myroides odoratimimus]MDM1509446.1 HAMP domain-containing histidine kinase [Myroides odoratimimus]MDM1525843.1 HAMP domain-containing histidine kinase [Myroides odoratimimus]MDM1679123.1 HAMP domain-containing histidine kinase [Myroides odoratimimus]MEC4034817.1 HAMP domain-containing sensor histidine kinase [Myroides odoratimimus]MEC4093598.1 HAMP domain-containing sensor histidine kinase [Myroides odoratimimus]
MRIKTRLTLLFTLLVASILLVFAVVVYWSSSKNREVEFFEELEKEAITKAKLYLETEVKSSTLHKIYRYNNEVINEVQVAVYDFDFNLLYHDAEEIDSVKETKEMIDQIASQGRVHLFQDDWQVIGIVYNSGGQDYVITAIALDQYGYTKLHNLFLTILVLSIVSLIVIFFVGSFFAERVLRPLKLMNEEINNITATNLDLRVSTEANQDELSRLGNTFNTMLDRLEQSFDSQKQFVSNISHELRTPLAAVIAELELSLSKEQDTASYIRTIENALSDAKKLVRLSNSLLDFAKASYDPTEIVFKPTRIDEVILDACQKIQRGNAAYTFSFMIDEEIDSEELVTVRANPYLLEVAIINLLENACKYSDNHHGRVSISNLNNAVVIKIADEGLGMSAEDLDGIFKPFFRGENGKHLDGNGIGLSLTKKVIDLHKGTITVTSEINKGTEFTITL